MGRSTALFQLAWLAGQSRSARLFRAAAADPERAQRDKLQALLRGGAPSAYGRAHGFDQVTSLATWQDRVPLVTYDDLAPWVDRICRGEKGVLTTLPVEMLERTSGSTRAEKLVPYTKALRADFGSAVDPWLFDLHRHRPSLLGTRSYWSVSPVARAAQVTEGGLPIGFEDDTAYFSPLTRVALRRLLAVPPEVAKAPSIEAWRRGTWDALLRADDLGFVSVWSPSFLTRLFDWLGEHLEELLADLPSARATAIRAGLEAEGALVAEALWPRLSVVSCWTEAFAAQLLPGLRRYLRRTPIQTKGLLATEGVVSFPLWNQPGAVLALRSHLLELADVEGTGRPKWPHEIAVGGRYTPILSTSGGFYRYRLQDVVRCVGFWDRAPLVVFEGRLDRTSDRVGEKLSEAQVREALSRVRRPLPFALVAPRDGDPPGYGLYLEAPADALVDIEATVEAALRENPHYAYARDLGQLTPLRAIAVRDGWARYEAALLARGQRLGDQKPGALDVRGGWDEVFAAR